MFELDKRMASSLHPVHPTLTLAYVTLAVIGMSFSVYSLMKIIHAYVWEHFFDFPLLLVVFVTFFMGFLLTSSARLAQRSSLFRTDLVAEPDQLSNDQVEAIRNALFAGDKTEATNLYREFSNAGLLKANGAIWKLAARLYHQHPEKFASDPNRPPPLDVKRLLWLLGGLAILLAPVYFALPQSWRLLALEDFLRGGILSAFIFLSLSRGGGWKRALFLMLMLGLINIPLYIAPRFTREIGGASYNSLSIFVIVLGFVVGAVLQKLAAKKPQKIGDRSRPPTH